MLNFGGVDQEDNSELEQLPEIKNLSNLTLLDIFKNVKSFISLDISKNSTGWGKWWDGEYTHGTFSIKSREDDLLGQRKEFREFLKGLFADETYEYVFIEDTIGSINYKTARILHQLNPIADDMMEMGLLPVSPIIREGNTTWKSNLKYVTGYVPELKGEKDKISVMNALYILGFGDKTTDELAEDEYDTTGIAVGCIVRLKMLPEKVKTRKLRTDITKVYKIEQFDDEYEALDRANEFPRKIHALDFTNINYDIKRNFKKVVADLEDDTSIFVITIPLAKLGAFALQKKLNLDSDMTYLVVYLPPSAIK